MQKTDYSVLELSPEQFTNFFGSLTNLMIQARDVPMDRFSIKLDHKTDNVTVCAYPKEV
tara:strand:- start:2 stop:178 length:177 start_codon:yes stop_codon:yes gene_type:complete